MLLLDADTQREQLAVRRAFRAAEYLHLEMGMPTDALMVAIRGAFLIELSHCLVHRAGGNRRAGAVA